MTSVPGVDVPEEQTAVDVALTGRGIAVGGLAEFVGADVVVVRPDVGGFADQSVARAGDAAEIYWKGPEDQRMLPARVQQVEQGAVVRWRLEPTGPAETSQRRKAVRGRAAVPVTAGMGSIELTGKTVDLSENGMRATFDGFGVPPDAGTSLDLTIELEDGAIRTKAQVVRFQGRGASWLMSIQFVDIVERDQDRVRRRVFQALREERARQAD